MLFIMSLKKSDNIVCFLLRFNGGDKIAITLMRERILSFSLSTSSFSSLLLFILEQ